MLAAQEAPLHSLKAPVSSLLIIQIVFTETSIMVTSLILAIPFIFGLYLTKTWGAGEIYGRPSSLRNHTSNYKVQSKLFCFFSIPYKDNHFPNQTCTGG